ncbi:PASTA domain-containing protein [Nocardia sp. NPDC004340]
MRAIAVVVLSIAVPLLAACNPGGETKSSSASSTSAAADSVHCDAKAWPLPMPDLRGQRLDAARAGDGVCFLFASATAPDGRNILDGQDNSAWVVKDQSPDPGALVAEKQPITVTVKSAGTK